jgi:hypothetical protein
MTVSSEAATPLPGLYYSIRKRMCLNVTDTEVGCYIPTLAVTSL